MLDRRYHNRELQMMKVMDHENVVRLRHYFEKAGRKKDETYLHLVMDFLPETIRSVALKYHKRSMRFSFDHIKSYLWQTFRALEYIHARRICHRDIKPDNLLCDPGTLQCRLCDFGCSKVLVKGQPNVSYICSRYYRAPELMFGATEYAVGVDVWSVGTILMELLLGHLPFQGQDSTQQHLVEIMKLLGTPTDRDLQAMRATCSAVDLPKLKPFPWERIFAPNTPPEAVDLAQRLLRYDPDQRLSASQALAHPFFEGAEQLLGHKDDRGSSSSAGGFVPPSEPPSERGIDPAQAQDLLNKFTERVNTEFQRYADNGHSANPIKEAEASVSEQVKNGGDNVTAEQLTDVLRTALQAACKTIDGNLMQLCEAIIPAAKPGARGAPSASGSAVRTAQHEAEEKRLEAELAQMKEAKKAIDAAEEERKQLEAQIDALQAQLNAAGGGAAGGAREQLDASVQTEDEGSPSRPTTPGFGRRAPQPSRVQSFLSGSERDERSPSGSGFPAGGGDNLGQVTPMASFNRADSSSESLPRSPGVQPRVSSAGRRRSRLAEGGFSDVPEEGQRESQITAEG